MTRAASETAVEEVAVARMQSGGIELDLPRGWEGRLNRRDPDPAAPEARSAAPAAADDRRPMVVHAANFPLPVELGDFGGGAVEAMRNVDLYLSLFEYGPESVGTALFSAQGLPRPLRNDEFDPFTMRTPLPGMSGVQRFFTEAGRAFSLYVVLGSHLRRYRTVPVVNQVLGSVRIS